MTDSREIPPRRMRRRRSSKGAPLDDILDHAPADVRTDDPIAALLFKDLEVAAPPAQGSQDDLKKFAIYARFSRSTQKQSSIARQKLNCEMYLSSIGAIAIEIFADLGKSAATAAGRDALMELLDRASEFDGIVVEDFDRFSRELYDAVEIGEHLERIGVGLHSAVDERRLSKEDIAESAMRAERDRIRRRNLTSAGLTQLVASGGIPSGACFGYEDTDVPGFPKPNPAQKRVVVKIMTLAAEGMSYARIARKLTEDGDQTPSGTTEWTASSVRIIVRRPIYAGRIYYRREGTTRDRKTLKVNIQRRPRGKIEKGYNERYRLVSDELFLAANSPNGRGADRSSWPRGRPDAPAGLLGEAMCDCPGASDQRFILARTTPERMQCSLLRRTSCRSRTHGFEYEAVERAAVRAVVQGARHRFDEQAFAAAYERRIDEMLRVSGERVAAVRRDLAEQIALRQRMFDSQLREGWSGSFVVQNRQAVEGHVARLKTELDRLVAIEADLRSGSGRAADLARAIAGLDQRLPFVAETESDHLFVAAFRRLVPKVVVEREGRPFGSALLVLEVHWDALLLGSADPSSFSAPETIRVEVALKMKHGSSVWSQEEMEKIARERTHALTDDQWALVAEHLPRMEETDHHGPRDVPTRVVADAIVFKMATGIPIGMAPLEFGDRKLMHNAMLRFVYAGGLEMLRLRLEDAYPNLIASLDFKSLAKLPRARDVSVVPRVAERPDLAAHESARTGTHRLTDDEWGAVASTIDDTVCRPTGRIACPIPARMLFETILLKLRTRCSWDKVPLGTGTRKQFKLAVMRVAYSGSWDRAAAIWRREHPRVLDGVDTAHIESKARSTRLPPAGSTDRSLSPAPTAANIVWDPDGRHRRVPPEDWMDLTDREWSIVAKMLPPASAAKDRRVIDGILFTLATRTPWHRLPARYGSHIVAYKRLRKFSRTRPDGGSIMLEILTVLAAESPQTLARMGRDSRAATPTAAVPSTEGVVRKVRARKRMAERSRSAPTGQLDLFV